MIVTLISTDGPWLEAVIATPHGHLTVMDEFSIVSDYSPKVGETFEVELSAQASGEPGWESMFEGNPERKMGLEQIDGWRYRGFGVVVSIKPVVVDCQYIKVSDILSTNDPRVIGEFITFDIECLAAG